MTALDGLLADHPLPDLSGGKDERSTTVIVGGPPACPGAVLLAGEAALRVGAGRVQLVVHPLVVPAVGARLPEAAVTGWAQDGPPPSDVAQLLADAGVVVIGPGHQDLPSEVVASAVRAAGAVPVVLDAGALGAVDAVRDRAQLVLAPNRREAQQLAGSADDEEGLATALARRLGQPVAVRGARSVVADGTTRWTQDQPPGLGTPGSGDVCIGALAGLLAAGAAPLAALGWAVALHARAGACAGERTPVGYLASDVVRHLPHALAASIPSR